MLCEIVRPMPILLDYGSSMLLAASYELEATDPDAEIYE
jgi:hypothetical protein